MYADAKMVAMLKKLRPAEEITANDLEQFLKNATEDEKDKMIVKLLNCVKSNAPEAGFNIPAASER